MSDAVTVTDPSRTEGNRFLKGDQALACIHCGLCLSSCPTYLETGNENESPRGRIYLMRALDDGRLSLEDSVVRHLDLCLGCRACEAACPSGVQYGSLLESTREHIERHYRRSLWQTFLRRVAIERIIPYPWRLKISLLPVEFLRRSGLWMPRFLRESLALLPARLVGRPLREFSPADPGIPRRGRVGFIEGCVMSVMFAETNEASVALLNRAGYDVVTPPGQGCCGALFAHGGQLEMARARARQNIVAFEGRNLEAIIINAAGCGSTLKEYGHLLENDPAWAERGIRFASRMKDLTEWLVEAGGARPNLARNCNRPICRVTYHDACHLAHPQGITRPPRELLKAVAGEQFVELPESDVCCGSAGSYNLTEPEMAARLQRRKVDNIVRTGAQVVVTTNPGCMLQIRAGLRAAGIEGIEVIHLADYLIGHAP